MKLLSLLFFGVLSANANVSDKIEEELASGILAADHAMLMSQVDWSQATNPFTGGRRLKGSERQKGYGGQQGGWNGRPSGGQQGGWNGGPSGGQQGGWNGGPSGGQQGGWNGGPSGGQQGGWDGGSSGDKKGNGGSSGDKKGNGGSSGDKGGWNGGSSGDQQGGYNGGSSGGQQGGWNGGSSGGQQGGWNGGSSADTGDKEGKPNAEGWNGGDKGFCEFIVNMKEDDGTAIEFLHAEVFRFESENDSSDQAICASTMCAGPQSMNVAVRNSRKSSGKCSLDVVILPDTEVTEIADNSDIVFFCPDMSDKASLTCSYKPFEANDDCKLEITHRGPASELELDDDDCEPGRIKCTVGCQPSYKGSGVW